MAKTHSKPTKKRPEGLIGLIFESEVANFVITANFLMFLFIHFTEKGAGLIDSFIVYPGNLAKGNYYCVITSGFLHFNWLHLGMNMLGIFIFARIVERHLGTLKTFYIYFGSMIISLLFSIGVQALIFDQNTAIIGASGGVMGLIAAAMLLDPFYITYEMILPIPVMFKGWIFLFADLKGLLNGSRDGISHMAHLFGFLSVALLVYFLSKEDKKLMRAGLITNIISFALFLLLRHWVISNQ